MKKHNALVAIITLVLLTLLSRCTWSQSSFRTLYTFSGGSAGSQPFSGLIMDKFGNLYGTTYVGGGGTCLGQGCGIVFELLPNKHGQSVTSWQQAILYTFNGEDGANPQTASLVLDKHGNLFGTTEFGGSGDTGVAFQLSRNGSHPWVEQVIYRFTGKIGVNPVDNLTFDNEGNLYGTTSDWSGEFTGPGTIFKLAPERDGNWARTVLHTFNGADGFNPSSGVVFDSQGNLYGTTIYGGQYNQGVVYRLSPNPDGTWTESVLHHFSGGNDGFRPQAGLMRDDFGNLFGVTAFGGANGYGTVYQLKGGDDSWTFNTLYAFRAGEDGANSFASLVMDSSGALYGTTHDGGIYACGVVFKLTPDIKGNWRENVVHTFDNKPDCESFGPLILDSMGNLYGTTRGDGTTTFGSVFEITP